MRHQRARVRWVPVSGDGLVPFRAFDGPLGAVAGPLDGEFAGEQPVVGDPEGGGLVVALAQLGQLPGVQGGVPAGAGFLHRLVRLAQDADRVGGPGLQAAGAELRGGAAPADDVLAALLHAGQPGQQPLVGLVPRR